MAASHRDWAQLNWVRWWRATREAVGCGFLDLFGADQPARAGTVVHDELLSETLGEFWLEMRAIKSAVPPAVHGTTMRAGREG